MLVPSGEKQTLRYEQAHQRALIWYKKYPELLQIEQRIAELLRNMETDNSQEINSRLAEVRQQHEQLLDRNNIPQTYKSPKFDCEKCQDSGWIAIRDSAASQNYGYDVQRVVKCKCLINAEQQQMLNKLFKVSRLSPAMKRQTFELFRLDYYSDIELVEEGYSHRQIMEFNKKLAERFVAKMEQASREEAVCEVKGLYLQGDPGVGKTFLCSAIANELLKRKIPVLYLPFVDFLYQLRGSFGDRSKKVEEFVDAARNVTVLILDDLGSESRTEFSQEILFSILNYRTNNLDKPTIISSNYTIDELKNMYHPRIASRIRIQADILHCVGEDLREIMK